MTRTRESTSDWVATTVFVAACVGLAFALVGHVSGAYLAIGGLAVIGAGAALTLSDASHVGLSVAAGGAALAAVAVPAVASGWPERGAWLTVIAAGLVLAVGSARGWFPAAVLAAGALLVLLFGWVVALRLLSPATAAAVLGVVSVLLLGAFARAAVAAAGLTRLSLGQRSALRPADLAPVIVVAAVSTAVAGVALALVEGVLAGLLAVLLAVVLLLRARVTSPGFAAVGVALAGAAVLLALSDRAAGASASGWLLGVALAVTVAAGAVVSMVARPSESIVDSARRVADVAETVAVVAVVPVALVLVLVA